MKIRRILLVTEPRLLREMVERVIEKTPGLQVVGEIENLDNLVPMIEATGADWLVIFLAPDEKLPAGIQELLSSHPAVRVLAIASDGSQVEMNWVEFHAKVLDRLNLEELISVLSNDYPLVDGGQRIATGLGIGFY
jgi:response regulator of citrate/malate metabolism